LVDLVRLISYSNQPQVAPSSSIKCVDAPGHITGGGTKDAEFIAEQALEVLEDSELFGLQFQGPLRRYLDGRRKQQLTGGENAREPA
jgi:hypothetical protein